MTTALQIACVLPLLAANVLACRYIYALVKARQQRRELARLNDLLLGALSRQHAVTLVPDDGMSN